MPVPLNSRGTLVILPGVNSGSYLFAQAAAHFPGWHLLLLDPPGVGGTALPIPLTAGAYARQALAQINAEIGTETAFCLFGHSLGSFAAQELARLVPHRITRLVLASSSIGQPQTAQDISRLQLSLGKSFWQQARDIAADPHKSMQLFFGPWPQQNAAAYKVFIEERQKHLPGSAASLAQLTAGSLFSSRGWAHRLSMPTLLIHGEADVLVSPAGGRALAGLLPHAQWLSYHGVGHFPMLEHPQFYSHVAAFLNGQPMGEELPATPRSWYQRILNVFHR